MITITNVTELQNMKNNLAADYELGNDIDASETSEWNEGAGFEPVKLDYHFRGSLDGRGFRIINLFINRPATDAVGLFSRIAKGTIKNVGLENANITGKRWVGGFLGYSNLDDNETVLFQNCYVTGAITSTYSESGTGGLIGKVSCETGQTYKVLDCYSTADITAAGWGTGGLIGASYVTGTFEVARCYATGNVIVSNGFRAAGFMAELDGGIVKQCYSTGNVSATRTSAGGGLLAGAAGFIARVETPATVQDCYSMGNVACYGRHEKYGGGWYYPSIGGLIGYNCGTIKRCYSIGSLTGDYWASRKHGGLIGDNGEGSMVNGSCGGGDIINSFWDTEASDEATSDGGTGKTTAQMKDINTILAAGWSIPGIWNVVSGCNSGYPCLVLVNLCCSVSGLPPLDPTIAPKKVSLELIRNLEMMNTGRFYISKSGNVIYESRFYR